MLQGVTSVTIKGKIMDNYKYILERSSKKYNCPECNQKKFTRYIDITTNEQLADHVGKCDRENNCCNHYTPKQFFNDNHFSRDYSNTWQQQQPATVINKPIDYLPIGILEKSVYEHQQCDLFPFFKKLFRKNIAILLCERYFIGTNKDGYTVFWQVDFKGEIRQAKVMQYNSSTGRRNKDTGALFAGKRILNNKDANLQQCFFGEILLALPENKEKAIAIVESEKTAAIASIYYPDFVWLATGGKHGCRWTEKNVCNVLKGRKVILFPDLGAYDSWIDKGKLLANVAVCKVVVSDVLENNANDIDKNDGLDLADYLLRVQDSSGLALTDYKYPVIWDL